MYIVYVYGFYFTVILFSCFRNLRSDVNPECHVTHIDRKIDFEQKPRVTEEEIIRKTKTKSTK